MFPEWDNADQAGSTKKLYNWLIQCAQKQIQWYDSRRPLRRRLAQGVRGIALILATLGAICPLAAPAMDKHWQSQLPILGYVFLAVGGLLVTIDKFFGFSNSWMRFASTQLSLEILLKEFQFDWVLQQSKPYSAETSIQKLKDFAGKVDGIVKQETDAWITDFKSNISDLEKMLKVSAEERKPGAIKLTIPNAKDFNKISISAGDDYKKDIEGVTEALFDSIPPGRFEISVSTTDKNGVAHKESKVVEVSPSATASVEITIR